MRPLALVVATLALLWSNAEAYPSANTMSNILLAYRFVTEGSARIDGVLLPERFADREVGGTGAAYNRFAPGTAAALTPVVALGVLAGVPPEDAIAWAYLDKVAAGLLVAAAAAAAFAAARPLAGEGPAFLAAFAIVAGTSLATIAGQRSWQHALGVCAVALGWLFLVRGLRDPAWLARAGLPFALGITARYPLGALWLLALAYVAVVARPLVPRYLLWSAGPLAFLAIYDAVLFGSPAATAYTPQLWQWGAFEGLPGNLVSPSRGLLVFSPFLLAGLWAIGRRARRTERLWLFALAACAALWLVHGTYIEWWGGWGYGNRYLLELTPILATGVALAWRDATPRWRWAIGAAIAFAVVLQVAGLLGYYRFVDGYNWDAVRETAERSAAMWDLRHPVWVWAAGAAVATGDARALLVVTVAAAFAYLGFRAGLARPRPVAA